MTPHGVGSMTLQGMSTEFSEFVGEAELATLPHRLRVAWAASVYEPVLARYSPYFHQHYFQQDALEMAWRYAEGGPVDETERTALLARLEDVLPDAEDENYGKNAVFPGLILVADIDGKNPQDSLVIVDNAAVMFGDHQIYRHGKCSLNSGVPYERHAEASRPVYRYARTLYELAAARPDSPITRGMFPVSLEIPDRVHGLSPMNDKKARFPPPPHEVEFILIQGWAVRA